MKIKEFFKNTKKTLGLIPSDDEENSKKKRLVGLLKKLDNSISLIKKELNSDINDEKRAELEEELLVYKLQIKKGQKILDKKNSE